MINQRVVELNQLQVIGMSCDTTMDEKDTKVPRLVNEFHSEYIHEVRNRINAPKSFGIFIDPPNWDPETEAFTWIAGVEVTDLEQIPKGMVGKTIPAHKYVVLDYHPQTDDINPYQFIHNWLKDAGYEQTGNFGFSVYHPYTGEDTAYSLHIPIK
ncbi:GyrI-like domain-containing protein [Salinibacillus xinjiangensis]|uniref:AraC family transcriptional regulator n=1 Tax=Salinibacillus xinjiangensis TaxID=1229268 RepID=A0A6G1X8G4_9BACI|nr:GyrI-like domain-containing protein [Salinibacillus xinjiangensis]MRG87196.1 AraC family transcriptional regulator [Salinibacillus xinjiangensis]